MYMRKLTSEVVCTYDDPVAQTKEGKLRGLKIDSTYIFRGIKYATAKRFHMPERVAPWEGIKEAIQYGYVCPELNTPIAHDNYYVPHFYYPQDEDCLNLNVWTQSLDPKAKKPVMVWIHGGGFSTGSSVELFSYDGENLSAYGDVVVVSMNHRLNVLGYLDLSKYGEEYKNSVNVGLADLVMALEWIRDNIANFGGDPDNVMIFGQSGGGSKVCYLMQTPAADGLFHRAVMQSGGANVRETISPEETRLGRQEVAADILKYLSIAPENVKELETVNYYDLADAASKAIYNLQQRRGVAVDWCPLPDGEYFMGHPLTHGFRRESLHIPLLVGNVYSESANNYSVKFGDGLKNRWSEEQKYAIMKERLGDNTDRVIELFKKAYPGRNIADALYIGKRMREGSINFSKKRAEAGGKTWTWLFNLECPFNGGTLPWHNAEECYVFHNAQYIEAEYIPDVSEKLQDQMTTAWIEFAKKGDPNHPGIPAWEPTTADHVVTMCFDRECEVKTDHDVELLKLIPPELPRTLPDSHPFMHQVNLGRGVKPED